MRTITEKLEALNAYKQDIKSAIIEKGQTVEDNMSQYADAIRNIEGGDEPQPPIIEGPDIPTTDPLTFYKLDDGDGWITIKEYGQYIPINAKVIQYQKNNEAWQTYTYDTPIPMSKGDYLRFRSTDNLAMCSNTLWRQFKTDGLYKCGGNVMSLKSNGNGSLISYDFKYLFKGSRIITTPSMPATTLANYCYQYMYQGCNELLKTEQLPATTLANGCYQYMYHSCTKLYEAPQLNAQTAVQACYNYMFYYCTSLYKVQDTLPSLVAPTSCYAYMFHNCTSLTKAPNIEATTVGDSAFYYMFSYCSKMKTAPKDLFPTTLANSCYRYMFSYCTSLEEAPHIHATTVAQYSCQAMFQYCTSMKRAQETLYATKMETSCYNSMFYGCSSLLKCPKINATTLAQYCFQAMFQNCSSITDAIELPVETLADFCYSSMFNGCFSLKNATSILPATNVGSNCYVSMYYNCTSLVNAPKIYAETIASNSMNQMFYQCYELNDIYCNVRYIGTTEITNSIASGWVTSVSPSGTYHKNPNWAGPTVRGTSTVTTYWQIVDWNE